MQLRSLPNDIPGAAQQQRREAVSIVFTGSRQLHDELPLLWPMSQRHAPEALANLSPDSLHFPQRLHPEGSREEAS